MSDKFSFLKRNFSTLIYYSFFAWLLIAAIFTISDQIFMVVNILLAIVLLAYLYYNNYIKHKISQNYGTVLKSFIVPKPFTSMLNSVLSSGYTIKDIKTIDFVSYDLDESCKYAHKLLDKIVALNPNIEVNFIGYGNRESCSGFKNINLFHTKEQISEHKNIIVMNNNKSYLWYEPSHRIVNAKHYFNGGGYFIEPRSEVLIAIEEEIKILKSSH